MNNVDTLIDMPGGERGLREDAINLINKVAKAQLTPVEATCRFLDCFAEKLRTRPQNSKTMRPEKQKVIKLYQKQVAIMKAQASIPFNTNGQHQFFDFLLGLNVVSEDLVDIPIIRDIIFKQKLELIRESQIAENRILSVINNYHHGWSRSEKHFAKLSLVYSVKDDLPLKRALEKLFCVSVASIQKDKKLCEDLRKHYQENAELYGNILLYIKKIVEIFQKNEQMFQGRLLKDFRTKVRKLSQKELWEQMVTVIKRKISDESQKTAPNEEELDYLKSMLTSCSIDHLESSEKILNLRDAQIICEALKIQPGYFFCSFFASLET